MTKIVRKVGFDGYDPDQTCGIWLRDGDLFGWWESKGDFTPEEAAVEGEGWPVTDQAAWYLGTTLAALRAELTEEGEG